MNCILEQKHYTGEHVMQIWSVSILFFLKNQCYSLNKVYKKNFWRCWKVRWECLVWIVSALKYIHMSMSSIEKNHGLSIIQSHEKNLSLYLTLGFFISMKSNFRVGESSFLFYQLCLMVNGNVASSLYFICVPRRRLLSRLQPSNLWKHKTHLLTFLLKRKHPFLGNSKEPSSTVCNNVSVLKDSEFIQVFDETR